MPQLWPDSQEYAGEVVTGEVCSAVEHEVTEGILQVQDIAGLLVN